MKGRGIALPHNAPAEIRETFIDTAHMDTMDVTNLPGKENWITLICFRKSRYKIAILTATKEEIPASHCS